MNIEFMGIVIWLKTFSDLKVKRGRQPGYTKRTE